MFVSGGFVARLILGVVRLGKEFFLFLIIGVFISEDVEFDRGVLVHPGEEATPIDFQQHGGQFCARQSCFAPAAGRPRFQGHPTSPRGREFEEDVVGFSLFVGDDGLHLTDAWRGNLNGADLLAGPFDVGRLEEMKEAFGEAGHAERSRWCGFNGEPASLAPPALNTNAVC